MTSTTVTAGSDYSIGAVAERTGVSVDTLRYYEKVGLLASVARTDAGRRIYSDDDCGWILFIRRLRAIAMPVSEIALYVSLVRNDTGTPSQRRAILAAHRDRVQHAIGELSEALTILDRKIEHYDAAELGIDLDCSEQPINTVRLVEQ